MNLDIGFKIRKFRELKGLTQQHMADLMGMAVSNYNKLENNKLELSVNRMMEIVKILNIDIYYLLEIENTHNVSQLFHDNNGFVTGNYNTNYICENIDDVVSKRKER